MSKTQRSLVGIAGIVGVATFISKIFGLVRQQAIAAAFGVGAVVDAYNYAYVIPGFLLILLGGINGPFHSAIVSVVAKRKREEVGPLVETITTIVGGILLLISIVVMVGAATFIDLIAPGLKSEVKAIAVDQLQIMAPMALLAGLIGIGFGVLNAADFYWLPSISPLLSSITVIIGLAILGWQLGSQINAPKYIELGGMVLAWGTLAGAILQWLMQLIVQMRAGLGGLRLRFNWKDPGVMEVIQIMGPATLSSGTLQINLYVDLYFASFIPQAAAAMQYAGLLVQTPLGILSNVILVPLLPMFARLADPQNWPELKAKIRQGLLLTALTMLPLSAIIVPLSLPIVKVIYERYAFNQAASKIVAEVLIVSASGMFIYLTRDVLVRVFYALGDGETPFRISVVNIFFNITFDYLLYKPFGTQGIVLATVMINCISAIALFWFLNKKLNGLPFSEWISPLLQIIAISIVAGLGCWGVSYGLHQVITRDGIVFQLIEIALSGLVGLLIFGILATQLRLPEMELLLARIRRKRD